MRSQTINSVALEELADILAETDIRQSKDLGTTLLHIGNHVRLGGIFIVTTITDASAYVVF